MNSIQLYQGDCLEIMPEIPDKTVDMILCDLPYGTTDCKWDIVIPFEKLWEQYKRIIKDNGVIALFGKQPFVSQMILTNREMFRYEIIWDKNTAADFANSNLKPLNVHENIEVFYSGKPTYNRIDDSGFESYTDKRTEKSGSKLGAKGFTKRKPIHNKTTRVPTTIRRYFPDNKKGSGSSLHPTQKPLALIEWLIKAFTDEGMTVMDNCMGSGTTGAACKNLNRNFIGIELDKHYFEIAKNRISSGKY